MEQDIFTTVKVFLGKLFLSKCGTWLLGLLLSVTHASEIYRHHCITIAAHAKLYSNFIGAIFTMFTANKIKLRPYQLIQRALINSIYCNQGAIIPSSAPSDLADNAALLNDIEKFLTAD